TRGDALPRSDVQHEAQRRGRGADPGPPALARRQATGRAGARTRGLRSSGCVGNSSVRVGTTLPGATRAPARVPAVAADESFPPARRARTDYLTRPMGVLVGQLRGSPAEGPRTIPAS